MLLLLYLRGLHVLYICVCMIYALQKLYMALNTDFGSENETEGDTSEHLLYV